MQLLIHAWVTCFWHQSLHIAFDLLKDYVELQSGFIIFIFFPSKQPHTSNNAHYIKAVTADYTMIAAKQTITVPGFYNELQKSSWISRCIFFYGFLDMIHSIPQGYWFTCEESSPGTEGERPAALNTLRPRQNGRRFADDTFKRIFLNENAWISLRISQKFVPKVQINDISALVKIMDWCRPGNKPLSESWLVYWHICASLSLNELTH